MIIGIVLSGAGSALAGSAQSQSDPADLAFWNSIANSKNPAEYRAYLETFPNGRFAPLARLRAGPAQPGTDTSAGRAAPSPPPPSAPPQTSPSPNTGQAGSELMKSLFGAARRPTAPGSVGPADAARAAAPAVTTGVLELLKPEWRASDAIRFRYDLRGLPPGNSHRVKIAPAGSPAAITEHFAFETESLFLTPPSGAAQAPPMPPGRYETRLYYIPQGRAYYELAAAQPFTVTAMKPGRIEAGALLTDLARGEVPFLASHRGKLLEIEAPFRESRTSGDNISISLGPIEGSAVKGSITCLAPLSDNAALQEAAAMKKGDTIVAGGFVLRVDTYNQTITMQPCAASANLAITFTGPEAKAEPKAQVTDKAAAPISRPPAASPEPARSSSPPPTSPPALSRSGSGAKPNRYAAIPKPPQSPVVNFPRTLSHASLRFPGGRPKPAAQPYLADLIKEVTAKNKAACEEPQSYQWDTAGWDGGRMMQTVQSVVDDLKEQGFAMKRLEKPYDNTLVLRVENPKEKADRPLLLAFYIEDERDLFLVACTTK